jgi:hypothetical protein
MARNAVMSNSGAFRSPVESASLGFATAIPLMNRMPILQDSALREWTFAGLHGQEKLSSPIGRKDGHNECRMEAG